MVVAIVAVGILTWVGATLLLDAYQLRRARPDLLEPLRPFHPPRLADEAQRWLDNRTHQ